MMDNTGILFVLVLLLLFSCGESTQPETLLIHGQQRPLADLTLEGGVLEGKATITSADGKVVKTGSYSKGMKTGKWTEKHDGILHSSMDFKNGKLHGTFTFYFENGAVQGSREMKNGKLDGQAQYFYPDSDPKEFLEYSNGLRDGKYEYWSKVDSIGSRNYVVGEYCDNEKCGNWQKYFSNGQLRWRVQMVRNKRHGEMKWWDPKGAPQEIWLYDHGELVEKQAWSE